MIHQITNNVEATEQWLGKHHLIRSKKEGRKKKMVSLPTGIEISQVSCLPHAYISTSSSQHNFTLSILALPECHSDFHLVTCFQYQPSTDIQYHLNFSGYQYWPQNLFEQEISKELLFLSGSRISLDGINGLNKS